MFFLLTVIAIRIPVVDTHRLLLFSFVAVASSELKSFKAVCSSPGPTVTAVMCQTKNGFVSV